MSMMTVSIPAAVYRPRNPRVSYYYRCQELVAERRYMGIEISNLKNGHCPTCGAEIREIWS